jgi:hypothetical protein
MGRLAKKLSRKTANKNYQKMMKKSNYCRFNLEAIKPSNPSHMGTI